MLHYNYTASVQGYIFLNNHVYFLLITIEACLHRSGLTAANSSTISFNLDNNISVLNMVTVPNVAAVVSCIVLTENDKLSTVVLLKHLFVELVH